MGNLEVGPPFTEIQKGVDPRKEKIPENGW